MLVLKSMLHGCPNFFFCQKFQKIFTIFDFVLKQTFLIAMNNKHASKTVFCKQGLFNKIEHYV